MSECGENPRPRPCPCPMQRVQRCPSAAKVNFLFRLEIRTIHLTCHSQTSDNEYIFAAGGHGHGHGRGHVFAALATLSH